MGYTLLIGDYTYSSWSLRGWLVLHRFGLPMATRAIDFNGQGVAEQLVDVPPARTVPTLITPEKTVIWDSLALTEELAQRHPDAGLWPTAPDARATARAVTSEMHSGFQALRSDCPMNLRTAYSDFAPSNAVRADLDRLETLWRFAKDRFGSPNSPWLFGAYSAADAFFAPVAARIAGYGLQVDPEARAYVAAHLADPAFRRWRAMGVVRGDTLPWYDKPFAKAPWPGPALASVQVVDDGPARNTTCPYSGNATSQYLRLNGDVWGFCNAFCRNKTAADPEAWPAFMEMVQAQTTAD